MQHIHRENNSTIINTSTICTKTYNPSANFYFFSHTEFSYYTHKIS